MNSTVPPEHHGNFNLHASRCDLEKKAHQCGGVWRDVGSTTTDTSSDSGHEHIDMSDITHMDERQALSHRNPAVVFQVRFWFVKWLSEVKMKLVLFEASRL